MTMQIRFVLTQVINHSKTFNQQYNENINI